MILIRKPFVAWVLAYAQNPNWMKRNLLSKTKISWNKQPFFCRFAWFMKNKFCLDNYCEIIASISHNLVSTKDCLRTSKYKKIKPNWGQKWWWWCGCGLIFLKQALVDSHIFGRPFSHRILMTSIWIMRSFSRKYLTEKRKEKKKYCSEFEIRTVVDIIKS